MPNVIDEAKKQSDLPSPADLPSPLGPDYWYNKYWKAKETEEFLTWWYDYYGGVADIEDDDDAQEEHYRRQAFTLMGWLAGRGELIIDKPNS